MRSNTIITFKTFNQPLLLRSNFTRKTSKKFSLKQTRTQDDLQLNQTKSSLKSPNNPIKKILTANFDDIHEKSQVSRNSQISNRHRNYNSQGEVTFTGSSDDKKNANNINQNYGFPSTADIDQAQQSRKRTPSGMTAKMTRKSPREQFNRT